MDYILYLYIVYFLFRNYRTFKLLYSNILFMSIFIDKVRTKINSFFTSKITMNKPIDLMNVDTCSNKCLHVCESVCINNELDCQHVCKYKNNSVDNISEIYICLLRSFMIDLCYYLDLENAGKLSNISDLLYISKSQQIQIKYIEYSQNILTYKKYIDDKNPVLFDKYNITNMFVCTDNNNINYIQMIYNNINSKSRENLWIYMRYIYICSETYLKVK